jgi:hypothetical protein
MIQYEFKNVSYISFKDISLGIMIGTIQDLLHGIYGRDYFIEINILFIHIKLGIIRGGNYKKERKTKSE